MRYVVAVEKGDKKHAYGVVVPDLPGCFSAGDTLDEALVNAKEAILLHLDGLLDDKQSISALRRLEEQVKRRLAERGRWCCLARNLPRRWARGRPIMCPVWAFGSDGRSACPALATPTSPASWEPH